MTPFVSPILRKAVFFQHVSQAASPKRRSEISEIPIEDTTTFF